MTNIKNHRFGLRYYFIVFVWLTGFSWCAQAELYPDLVEVEAYPDRVVVDENGKINFVLVQGDYVNGGARAMMRESPPRFNKNEWVYYSFGLDLTSGWPIDESIDALIVQWRNGDGGPYCSIHLVGNEIYIRIDNPVKKWFHTSYRNSVNEVLINAIWSEQDNGRLIVQINGDIVVDYSGPTLYNNDIKSYLAFGVYKPRWNELSDPENKVPLVFTHFEFDHLDEFNQNYRLFDKYALAPPNPPKIIGQ